MDRSYVFTEYADKVTLKLVEALTFDDVQIVPRYSVVESRTDVSTRTQLTRNRSIDIPLIAAPMDSVCGEEMVSALLNIGAAGCVHRFMSIEQQRDIILSLRLLKRLTFDDVIMASIGATGDYQERADKLLKAGATVLIIDVAHGDHVHVQKALNWLNQRSDRARFDVIAGNIATADAATRLQDWGADALRVGVGGGSMCETRMRTGIGVPQLQAVIDVVSVANIPVISDGGIRHPGDVAKAFAAGADTVMIGSLFAGTNEAPGGVFVTGEWPNETRMKVYRGAASATAKHSIKGVVDYVEGTATLVPARGPVSNVVQTIMDGVRSAMSYVGAHDFPTFRTRANFIRITNAGVIEAHPHGLR